MQLNFNYQFDAAGNLRAEQSFPITQLIEFRLGRPGHRRRPHGGNPGATFGISTISGTDAAIGDMACIIGHPAGVPKRIEAGPVTALPGTSILYNDIDTLGGNSGSGILRASDGTIVGVHTNGGCNVAGTGSNAGVRIASIVGQSPTLRRLMSVVVGSPAVFGRHAGANKKSIYVVVNDGHLAQVWDTDQWNLDFPAELAGQPGLRFQADPAVFGRDAGANKKSLYAITADGRLAQVWDTDRWNLDFPAELSGQPGLRFRGAPAVFGRDAGANKKSIYVVTADGRLAQVWDTDRWNLDFPAELSGQPELRFQAGPAVFGRDAGANKKSLYAITTDGRLAQVWDTDRWNLDFPAELAGQPGLRFRGAPAVFGRDAGANKKSLYAITTDGRLAQVWDTDRWNLDFPAELAGQPGLRFRGAPAVFGRDAGANKKSLYAITTDGRLAQVWDTDRWNLDFPAELAGQPGLRFRGAPAVFGRDAGANKKSLYLAATGGRLTQVWDTDRWNLDFP